MHFVFIAHKSVQFTHKRKSLYPKEQISGVFSLPTVDTSEYRVDFIIPKSISISICS